MSKDKMTDAFYRTLPWRIASRKRSECFYVIHGKDGDRELQILKMHFGPHPIPEHIDRHEDNAEAICRAVNGTYGNGIDPAAVKDLYEALAGMLQPFSHIGGVGWKEKSKAMTAARDALKKAKIN